MPRVLMLLALLAASSQQQTPMSPCPNVFSYEPPGSEPGRWYGVVNLSTDSILHSVWINIVLDSKADILGNWVGDVTTSDNTDFKIENTKMRIHPGPATAVRFFVQYNPLNKAPKVTAIRLNGREICNSNTPLPAVDRPDDRRTTRPDIRPEDTAQSRPVHGQPSGAGPVYSSTQNPVPQNPVNLNIGGGPIPAQSIGSQTSTGTQTGSGFGSGTQTGSNFGSGTQTGSSYGSGTQGGNGFGSGTGTQTGSDYGSQTSSSTQGGNGFGSGTGTQSGSEYGSQTNSGTQGGNGFGSNTQTGSAFGSGTQSGNGFSSGSQTGSNLGTGTQSGSGFSTGTSNSGRPGNGYRLTTAAPMRTTTRYDDEEDFDDKNQYFEGPQPTFIVSSRPTNNNNNNNNNNAYGNNNGQTQCGKVVRNNPNPLVVNGHPTLEGQWPWQIALYQTQTVDNKYICGGTLVSRSHVITAAHCVTRKGSNRVVNQNTLTVYLGKHNLRTSVEGVQIKLVGEIRVHPSYNASSYSRDVSVLKLREQARYTDWVRPACLWPDNEIDLSNVIGKKGSVVGWGFDDKGVATEELTLVEMPVVDQETCIRSYSEFFARFTSDYTFCAGYKDGNFDKRTGTRKSSSVCNGDSGGGMVFYMRNAWFLRGIVSLSVARQNEYRCDPTHYVVFTDLAKFLPWIRQNINDE